MKKKNSHWLNKFLWNIAGFKQNIISKCGIDKFHAKTIAILLIIVGLYASLAWTFFFQTFSQNLFISIIAGLFMGLFIISFDRALISSMASGKTNYYSIGFRFMLAIVLGVFLSQPMILKFYGPEIHREVQILADQKVLERKVELEKIYKTENDLILNQKLALETELSEKQNLLQIAEQDFKTEMDGSAGTGKWGYSTVAKQKEQILKRHQNELSDLRLSHHPRILNLQSRLDDLTNKISNDMLLYQNSNNTYGTLIQAEALQSLLRKDESGTLRFRFVLLSFILILIELSALIAKMLFKTESYKKKISLITAHELAETKNEKDLVLAKLADYQVRVLANEINLQKDYFKSSQEVLEEKREELKEEWRHNQDVSAKEYWQKYKKMLMLQT